MKSLSRRHTALVQPRGFSLIEILVVIVIIAFATKMVTYSFGGDIEEELEKQALKTHGVINMASEFAVLNQVELGFHLDKNVLEMLVFDGDKWATFEAEELYKPIEFGEEYRVALNIEDLAWAQDNLLEQSNWRELMGTSDEESLLELKKLKVPQVLILSSGEVSAFQLTIELAQQSEPVYFIEGEFMAPVKLRKEPEE
ncbi:MULTISPECIES: prepilin-type N-terminal cleavage/methylation domain-containing protein [Pseudoalteromonas]|uniref:Type II secretion system protein GspH n=1 Tax=Pseudoalteromonas amylolytica TaxID=1859457 RepID=A0A1S1MJ33_9GAMM|nr:MULTISPECIES: prepilin-type N-terminal cleavage/methylation domain-containing protein [Pseudoalteromonas]OHU86870.1 type II secretion system protein GspH [Pseudoalteromonas amylolytica]OHU89471.1 type II secretion system protein GspH [Pseudoalteromonas sp. JW3]